MRILVTGSSGRLGQRVVRTAREMGHEVIPVDIQPPPGETDSDTRIIDLTKVEGLPKLFDGVDAICHLGNQPAFFQMTRSAGYLNNTAANYNVFLAADQVGIQRIVYASSVQAYGCLAGASGPPFPNLHSNPQYLPIDEDHPLLPADAYPLSKAGGEWIAESFCRQRPGRTVWSLRYTAIRDGEPRSRQRSGDGRPALLGSLFTWIHVDDAARATVLALQTERPGHTPLNILSPTSARPWTPEMLIDAYGQLPEFRRPLTGDDALLTCERAAQLLGFRAQRTREDLAA